MTDDAVYGPTDARPGQPGDQPRTTPVPPMPPGAPPMPLAPPLPATPPGAWGPTPAPTPAEPLGVRETLSRTVFGGFWCLVALGGVIAAISRLADGDFGSFLLFALVAAASGFYARYIFRGGRFRILFF
jgi:hypothetical protein